MDISLYAFTSPQVFFSLVVEFFNIYITFQYKTNTKNKNKSIDYSVTLQYNGHHFITVNTSPLDSFLSISGFSPSSFSSQRVRNYEQKTTIADSYYLPSGCSL